MKNFLHNISPIKEFITPVRLESLHAVNLYDDRSLDFVFIDASHEYNDVKNDILAWLPKIKPGGILAGHDYTSFYPGVIQAVKEVFKDNNIVIDNEQSCFIYTVPDNKKLLQFPSINVITVLETEERRNLFFKKIVNWDINQVTVHIFEKYKNNMYKFEGKDVENFVGVGGRGPVTSHLRAIKKWYETTDDEYTFFCEDDLSFETIKYWNFTWEDFFNKLPKEWKCVQLSWVREEIFRFSSNGLKFRPRCWCDWSACAYIIKRSHAKKLIETYYPNDTFVLELKGDDVHLREDWAKLPVVETIIFSPFGGIFGIPLFVEDVNICKSTYSAEGQAIYNTQSYQQVTDWWKIYGQYISIEDFFKE